MKKFISLILVAVIALSLASCTTSKVKVNGTKIDNEIYAYFEARAEKNEDGETDEKVIMGEISRYVAINSEFANRCLVLDSSIKSEVSTLVNDLWHLYGSYYEENGISKQTIYKIELSNAYEDALLADYYAEDGDKPVTEDEIKKYFGENYAAIRFVTGYLFNVDDNGANTPMTDSEKTKLTNSFKSVAEMVNEGTSIEEAVGSLGENTEVRDTVINAFSDGTFPEGFWKKAKSIEKDKTEVITVGDYIFLVNRVDIFSEEYGYYNTYRTDCLKQMKGEEFSAVIDSWAENYKAE